MAVAVDELVVVDSRVGRDDDDTIRGGDVERRGREAVLDSVRVLFAAKATVLEELAKKSPRLKDLPDVQVLA